MTAVIFRLHRLSTGAPAGWALVCVEARYASIALPGVTALVRRHPSAAEWKAIAGELALGLNPGPLPATAALSRVLAGADALNLIVQYVSMQPVGQSAPFMAEELDSMLRGVL